ncbi:MAG: S-methyl-5'-thioadenosine phosphorylase [Bacteroidales bacterium]|nr:S-methyl-5'-thioadenosine phosphorylase [Bacteroidota bacterium]MBL6950967.1 S-methyl-5'-thioadenosine phosphorylase [Bacteroidales bacterium]
MVRLGLIGGSGLEKLNILENTKEVEVSTPYGPPSSSLYVGRIGQCEVIICSRHGREHTIPPTQINNRANIDALRQMECQFIIATTACGSLREEIKRGDIVILDQFIDFTRHRKVTFYDEFVPGQVMHAPMADPFSEHLRNLMIEGARELELSFHPSGTVVTIEGPRFSTRAESNMFRILGADVINMSLAPEVVLAVEAEIPYAAIALSTDYDSWKTDEVAVTWDEIVKVFNENIKHVTRLLIYVINHIKE